MLLFLDFFLGKVENCSDKPSFTFFSMDNPTWYLLATAIITYGGYKLAVKSKKIEFESDSQKVILDRRLSAHIELMSQLNILRNLSTTREGVEIYLTIFDSVEVFRQSMNNILNYASLNDILLTKRTRIQVSLLNNFSLTVQKTDAITQDIQNSGILNYNILQQFYENLYNGLANKPSKISLNYTYEPLEDKDFKDIEVEFKQLKSKLRFR